MSSDNPYRDETNQYSDQFGATPDGNVTFGESGEIELPAGQRRGLIGHVPIVGWLMVTQGVFELVLGIGLIVMAFVAPTMMASEFEKNPALQNQAADLTPQQLGYLITAVYGGMGVGLLLIGSLSIVAGFRMARYRSHTLGIVGLSAGFFSVVAGCYCFPTALLLGVYGLIVMLNAPVKMAFDIGKQGYSRHDIRNAFADCPK